MEDKLHWKPSWKIYKFNDPTGSVEQAIKAGLDVELAKKKFEDNFIEMVHKEGNLLLNNGITVIWNLLTGAAGQTPFNNANSRLGVGDSTTAASATQTGLQATTNHYWQLVDAGFPSVSNQTTTWQATFGGSVANYAWNEFVVDNNGAAGSTSTSPTYSSTIVALNRLVSSQGTKSSGQTWVLQLSITLS
jgi:hypothetical protein